MSKPNKAESGIRLSPKAAANTAEIEEATPERRNWLYAAAAAVIGGLVSLVPIGIGLATFIDPWRRSPKPPKSRRNNEEANAKEGFIRVASLNALTVGALPQRFPVIADQMDAWNFSPTQPVGAVFLQRTSDKQIRCFNATCPHAGCSVACNGQGFVCPCHNSSFLLNGDRRPAESGRDNPSPRNLDDLEVDLDQLALGEIWVRFQNFYTGKREKVPKQ